MGMSLIWMSVSAPGKVTRPSGSSQVSGESAKELDERLEPTDEGKGFRSLGIWVNTETLAPDMAHY